MRLGLSLMFPRDIRLIFQYALNRSPKLRYYRISELPEFLPWLLRYYLASSPDARACGARWPNGR